MNKEEISLVAQAGVSKHTVASQDFPRYFVRGMMAGFYLALGLFSCNIINALFASSNPAMGKVLGSLAFGIGLVAILLLGGDLFTGNNFVLCVSALEKQTSWRGVLRVWVTSYLGNAVGSFLIVTIFVLGGSMNALLAEPTAASVASKLSLSVAQMIFRGILCNFTVCAAVLAGIKIKDVPGKIAVIIMLIFTFILAGYEHCVANMIYYSLAFYLVPDVSPLAVANSMLWVTVGNIIGGMMLAIPYWYVGLFEKKK